MRKILMFIFIIPLLAFAQKQGIQFIYKTNWKQIKDKAKTENKHIFVDCYTTWCGPCKWMSENVFVQQEVGNYFNANFVNLKLQFDKGKNDSEDIISWYLEAERFDKEYQIMSYPTYLIFNPNGELIDRFTSRMEVAEFLERIKKSLSDEPLYFTLKQKFDANLRDLDVSMQILPQAIENSDWEIANVAFNNLAINLTKDEFLKHDNLSLIITLAEQGVENPAFKTVYSNKTLFGNYLSEKKEDYTIDDFLINIIYRSDIIPKLEVDGINFETVWSAVTNKYEDLDLSRLFKSASMTYCLHNKLWFEYIELFDEAGIINRVNYMHPIINNTAMNFFEKCEDTDALKVALGWSKKTFEVKEEGDYMHTYANLLYKLGDSRNAISWMEKAIGKGSLFYKEQMIIDLDKMKKGLPTW